jgi:hypothetical protein
MASMKVRVVNPYMGESEETMTLGDNTYKHTHQYTETIEITHERQNFRLYWDDDRNALKIIDESNNGTLCVIPSTANGIFIKSVRQ